MASTDGVVAGHHIEAGNVILRQSTAHLAELESRHPAELKKVRATLRRALWARDGYPMAPDARREAEADEVLTILLSNVLKPELMTLLTSEANQLDPVDPAADPTVNHGILPSEAWDPVISYRCKGCHGVARRHPQTAHLWGCPKCNFVTASLALSFEPCPHGASPDFVVHDANVSVLARAL